MAGSCSGIDCLARSYWTHPLPRLLRDGHEPSGRWVLRLPLEATVRQGDLTDTYLRAARCCDEQVPDWLPNALRFSSEPLLRPPPIQVHRISGGGRSG
jgi:hypothetical protein